MKRAIRWRTRLAGAGSVLAVAGLWLWLAGPLPLVAQSAAEEQKETQEKEPQETAEAREAAPATPRARLPRASNRRDPFRSLVFSVEDVEGIRTLPPGKAGLMVSLLTVNGIVISRTGNIAVVTMRGRNRAYFLREGDAVFKGRVARVLEDGVVFKERTLDAFGREFQREVVKRLSSAGAKP